VKAFKALIIKVNELTGEIKHVSLEKATKLLSEILKAFPGLPRCHKLHEQSRA